MTDRVATYVVSALGSDTKKNFAHDAMLRVLSFAPAESEHVVRFRVILRICRALESRYPAV